MTEEELLATAYSMGYPGDEAIESIPDAPLQAIREAPALEDALTDALAGDSALYCAFLKDALQRESIPAVDARKALPQLDKTIAQRMWKEQVDYGRIIRCMACSPRYRPFPEKENRWMLAAGAVTDAVSPMLSQPWTAEAKPVVRLGSLPTNREVYLAYLKAAWTRSPEMRLPEAERSAIRAMAKGGISEGIIRAAMEENSLQFPRPERPDIDLREELSPAGRMQMEDYEKAWKKRRESMERFIGEALEGSGPEPKEKESAPQAEGADDAIIYRSMQEKLRAMKASHDTGDILAYWEQAIRTMQDALLQIEQAKSTCKVLALWSIGLEKAARELGQEMSPEIKEMQKTLDGILRRVQEQDKDWDFIYRMMSKVDVFSRELLRQSVERRERSPLLKRPEVQHAQPLAEVLAQDDAGEGYGRRLYHAALREAALRQDGLDERNADRAAAAVLLGHGVFQKAVRAAMKHSPALGGMTPVEQELAAMRLVEGAAKEAARGGERT